MKTRWKPTAPFIILGVIFTIILTYNFVSEDDSILLLHKVEAKANNRLEKLPDFSNYNDVKVKKEAFFITLYPIIQEENQHVLKLRSLILKLQELPVEELTKEQVEWLTGISRYYKLENETVDAKTFNNLLKRVDFIPPSLILTQAAIESGWGSSRFSKQGNNIFGQWCFSKGCGMVPASRDSDKGHEVAKFATVNKAVRSYIRNINTNSAYVALREKRASLRQNDQTVTGAVLAKTLTKYSEEGHHYVEKLTTFIRQNKLQRFTKQFEHFISEAAN